MIIQISGKLREGKGILQTLFSLGYLSNGYKFLSNRHIFYKNCFQMDFYAFLELLRKPEPIVPTGIDIDELPTWIDSYCTTTSKSNRMASHFLNQSAKLGYDPIIYTTQRTRRADINYREMVNVSYQASKNALCAKRKCPVDCLNLRVCHFEYVMLDPNIIDEDIPMQGKKPLKIPFNVAQFWWNKYNTFERVVPPGLDEFFFELEKTDPQRLLATVNRQADLLKEKGMRGRFTQAQVKLALMDCGELPFFAEYVAVRLQQR